MKFNIAKNDILAALDIVLKGVSSRSSMPILACVLIEAQQEGNIVLQTTDLEISIKHTAQADVIEPGRVVIPAKVFSDIVRNLPEAAVSISSENDQAQIACMDTSYTLSTLNPMDFPYFPEVDVATKIALPTDQLSSAVKKVGKAVSRDEARMILTGILFEVLEGEVRLVATDSYRLAVASMKVDAGLSEEFKAIIPGKTFEDVARAASANDEISIGFSENQIVFEFGSTIFISRKIEGTYPNYRQLIPADHAVTVTVATDALETALKRVAILVQAQTPVKFEFDAEEQTILISSHTDDVGGAKESVEAKIEGESITMAFNHRYILDGLDSVSGDTVLELQTPVRPGIIKSSEDDGFFYLAMPVRLS